MAQIYKSARLRKLDALYAQLPKLPCQRKCQESCGPIVWAKIENQNIGAVIDYRFRYTGSELTCPYLENQDCGIYEVRPMICRLWGIVRRMACPFGCVPDRWLTDDEGYELLQQVQDI